MYDAIDRSGGTFNGVIEDVSRNIVEAKGHAMVVVTQFVVLVKMEFGEGSRHMLHLCVCA